METTKSKGMQLLTDELLEEFAKVGAQEDTNEPVVLAKFFNPSGAGTWFATSYDPETRTFFGYVSIFCDHNDEWGSFSLEELKSYGGPFGLGIEQDLYFTPKVASQALSEYYAQRGVKPPVTLQS